MMDKEKLVGLLSQSLADHRLSKEERGELKGLFASTKWDKELRAFVRNRVFDVATSAIEDNPVAVMKWTKDVLKGIEATEAEEGEAVEVLFSPGEAPLHKIRSLLRNAKTSADICVFTITDNRIAEAIVEASERGVRVRIISDNDKSEDRGSDIESLAQKKGDGIQVRLDRSEHHMHHKFALFDGEVLLTGSYNWTRSAEAHNRENILVSRDPEAISAFAREFEALWVHLAD